MRRRNLLLTALAAALLFSGCGGTGGGAPPQSREGPAKRVSSVLFWTLEPPAPDNGVRQLYERYVDVSALQPYDTVTEECYVFDDRRLALEEEIKNELEGLAFAYFYDVSAAEFDALMELIGEYEPLQIAMKNEGKNFHEGIYMSEYVIHGLTTLTRDDLPLLAPHAQASILRLIETFDFEAYAVVMVDFSCAHNEASLRLGPELEDGRYTRFYLFAKTAEAPAFRMYEVYWDDFLSSYR